MFSKLVLVAGTAALLATGSAWADGFTLKAPPKIAFLYFKAKNDGGWTQAFDEARPKMEKALGMQIPYVENIAEDAAQITPPPEKFIQRGYNIIIGTAFGYSDTFKELAAKHPEVAFLNAAGTTNGPNLESFYGRTYESQYLCGMVAGGVSKTGKLGFVGANPFGIVNWTVNAYELGAQKINPKATVTAVFTGAWNDPVKERAAAEALVDQGIDVIGQHVDTPTRADRRAGARHLRHRPPSRPARIRPEGDAVLVGLGLGQISDHRRSRRSRPATGRPAPMAHFIAIKDGGTDIACCSADVPKDVVDKVMAARQEIIDGKRRSMRGPIKDRDGKERVAAGKVLSDGDLWKMDWYRSRRDHAEKIS